MEKALSRIKHPLMHCWAGAQNFAFGSLNELNALGCVQKRDVYETLEDVFIKIKFLMFI